MSDQKRSPAVAVWEFSSIVEGVHCADAIAKGAPVDALLTGTTHPGKYVVLVSGDTASVEVAADIVGSMEIAVIDMRVLPDIAIEVAHAVTSDRTHVTSAGDAIGLVETSSVASGIDAADAAVKAASVSLGALRMADGIGGKAYIVVDGSVGDVQAAVEAAVARAGDQLIAWVVIPQITDDLRSDLAASARFLERVRAHRR